MSNGLWAQSGICFNLTSCSEGYTAVGAIASTQCVGQAWSPPTVSCPRKVFNPTLQTSTAMVMMVKRNTLDSGCSICIYEGKFEILLDYIEYRGGLLLFDVRIRVHE